MGMELYDYKTLNTYYETLSDFTTAVNTQLTLDAEMIEDVVFATSMKTKFINFLTGVSKAIYHHYQRDQIAYENITYFIERLCETLIDNVNRYYQLHNIDLMIGKNEDEDKYILTSITGSRSKETGNNASSVTQTTATTPTGIAQREQPIDTTLKLENVEDGVKSSIESTLNPVEYVNYIGSSGGTNTNVVDKSNDITRTGNFQLAIDLWERLPKTFIDVVLKEVSMHFIFIY